MKIVLVTDSYYGENGGCVATRRLTEGLKKRGHKVSIVATDVKGEGAYAVKGKNPSIFGDSLTKMQFLFGIPEKDVLRKAFADADIIQIQLPFYLGYGSAKLARSMNKCFMAGHHVQAHNVVAAAGKDSRILDAI